MMFSYSRTREHRLHNLFYSSRVLGIDEHFFSRRKGFATTFCNLENHTVYDVVAGRSEAALEPYLRNLKGKQEVRVVCMDLSSTYRALVRKHFPHARIVADRFHVIRLVLQQFLACWKTLDPVGAKNRALLSLLRRHRRKSQARPAPALATTSPATPLSKPCGA